MEPLRRNWLPVTFVLVWSSAYVASGVITHWIAPLSVTLWRFVVAAGLLALIAWYRRERWPTGRRELIGAIATGVLLFAVQFAALYLGLAAHMPTATTALIACSAPLFVASASAAMRWERLSPRRWAGVAIGLLGVVVTLADRLGRPPSAAALGWTSLGLSGLVIGTLLQSRLRFQSGPAALASVELFAGAAAVASIAPFAGSLAIPLTLPALAVFSWIAIVAGVGGPLMLFALIRERGATGASSLLFVVPALTALEGWAALGSRIGPAAIAGLAIAGFGLWLGRASTPVRVASRSATGVRADSSSAALVPRHSGVDGLMAQDFGFVGAARARRNTLCISSTRAGATEPKDKPATHQLRCGEVLVHHRNGASTGQPLTVIRRRPSSPTTERAME